jgi:hypothetical protein
LESLSAYSYLPALFSHQQQLGLWIHRSLGETNYNCPLNPNSIPHLIDPYQRLSGLLFGSLSIEMSYSLCRFLYSLR